MNKIRFLSISTAVLLLLNVLLIAFLIFGKPKRRNPDDLKNLAIEKLHLDTDQVAAYELLIKAHRLAIKTRQDSLRQLKEKLYESLSLPADPATPDSILLQINSVQRNIEYVHLGHFQALKQLCRPDQSAAFNMFTQDIAKHLAPPQPGKKP